MMQVADILKAFDSEGAMMKALGIPPTIAEHEPGGQRKRIATRGREQARQDLWKALGIAG
jgi:hypothetical protein